MSVRHNGCDNFATRSLFTGLAEFCLSRYSKIRATQTDKKTIRLVVVGFESETQWRSASVKIFGTGFGYVLVGLGIAILDRISHETC